MASRTKKRQAAALVVQSLFATGKKSTAQPRPAVHIPPRGIGPITDPNPNDVLCGRGGRINAHEGNVQFREIVAANKKEYLAKTTKKLEKAHIAARIVETIRCMDPPGRFLKEDSDTGMWYDIGDVKAIKKAGQALREDAPDIRTGNESDEDGDSPPKKPPPAAAKVKSPAPAPMVSQPVPPPPLAPTRGTPTGGRVSSQQLHQHASFNSTGSSSTFGMPLPAQVKAIPPAPPMVSTVCSSQDMSSFPATASVSSVPFSGVAAGTGMYANQIYQSLRNVTNRTSGSMSERAVEMMHSQQLTVPPPNDGQAQSGNPDDFLFGRGFTPTELSSGSMSTISGMSLYSSNMTGSGSRYGNVSLGSSTRERLNPIQEPNQSMRMAQLNYPHICNSRSSQGGSNDPRVMDQMSHGTNNYMASSGVTHNSSFGDDASAANMSLSDASMMALLSEDKNVEGILAGMPPPMSSGTSNKSSTGDRFMGPGVSSAMSVTSMESGKTHYTYGMQSIGSDREWANPHVAHGGARHRVNSGQQAIPWDSQSIMSDVSDKIVALDLEGPKY